MLIRLSVAVHFKALTQGGAKGFYIFFVIHQTKKKKVSISFWCLKGAKKKDLEEKFPVKSPNSSF